MGLCGLEAVIENYQELGSFSGGDDAAGAPVGRVGAPFDQARRFEVIEEVGHDRAVDSEVLGQGELAADGAVRSCGEHLIAAGAAGQVRDGRVRGRDVSAEDRPEPPSQIVGQRMPQLRPTPADSVISEFGHDVIILVVRKKIFDADVLYAR